MPDNYTNFANLTPFFVHNYRNKCTQFIELKSVCAEVDTYACLVLGVLGFLGGLWTTLTFAQRRLKRSAADFFLFRVIGFLEMTKGFVAVMSLLSYKHFFDCEKYYACTFFWAHLSTTLTNFCADAIDLIVLFTCVERTIACILPHYFRRMQMLGCPKIVAVVSMIAPLMSTFRAFELTVVYDANAGSYRDEPSSFSRTTFYAFMVKIDTIRFYVTASLIAAATVTSIIGFRAAGKRNRMLTKNSTKTSLSSKNSSSQLEPMTNSKNGNAVSQSKKRQRDLCSLQLCLATPVVLNHALYATGLNVKRMLDVSTDENGGCYDILSMIAAEASKEFYSAAVHDLNNLSSFQLLQTSTNISNVLAHALHFYLYLLFCQKVRHAFVALLKTSPSSWCKKEKTSAPPSRTGTTMTMADVNF